MINAWWIVRIWKKLVVSRSEQYPSIYPDGPWQGMKTFSQDGWLTGWDSNRAFFQYETRSFRICQPSWWVMFWMQFNVSQWHVDYVKVFGNWNEDDRIRFRITYSRNDLSGDTCAVVGLTPSRYHLLSHGKSNFVTVSSTAEFIKTAILKERRKNNRN